MRMAFVTHIRMHVSKPCELDYTFLEDGTSDYM